MFKNIQKNLLLNNPLLWNLKIIPFGIIALIFHIIFFSLGYVNGTIDFSSTYYGYNYEFGNGIIIFFSILISILTFIIWIVLYSRNNAFKSFYPKNDFSIFKEWLFILLFCILNSTFSATFTYAKDLRAKSYFSEKEFNRRIEILSLSSAFLDGSFKEGNITTVIKNGQAVRIEKDSFDYNNRQYSLKSLLNKNIVNFAVFSHEQDSLNELKVKTWMVENKKDSIKWLLNEFMKISNEHNLKSNITADQWFDYVYSYPEFTNYKTIGKIESEVLYESDYYQNIAVTAVAVDTAMAAVATDDSSISENNPILNDTVNQAIKTINGQEYVYSKYYVPFKSLENSYGEIARILDHPQADFEFFLIYLYVALGLSLALFSFKVTSGKNWLIGVVSLGVFGIISGFIAVIGGEEITFLSIYVLLFFLLLTYFIIILRNKKSKGISGITLNQVIWLFPGTLPILYFLILQISKQTSDYYNYIGYTQGAIRDFPKIEWLENHFDEMMIVNIALIFLFMLIMSIQIKKWKGIAEA